jgi:DnaJ like chaperone protein
MSYILTFIVGALFYWLFTSSNNGTFSHTKEPLDFEEVLYSEYGYIIALVAKLAKSDGHVSDLEVELIENILDDLCDEFHDPIQARAHLKLIFNEEKDVQDNVAFVASGLYDLIENDVYKHQKILEFLITLSFIDGELHPREEEVVLEVARALHFSIGAAQSMFNQFNSFYEERSHHTQATNSEAYYTLLGIDENYDEKTLKRAYKKGVKEHHPDVVMGKGGSEEDIKQATSKLQDINEAYEYLKKQKNF